MEVRREERGSVAVGLGAAAPERRRDGDGDDERRASTFTEGEVAFARWLVHDLLRRLIDEAERKAPPEEEAAE